MNSLRLITLAVAATATIGASPAFAWQPHHHRAHRAGSLNYYDQNYVGSYGGSWEGAAIARATERMQYAPGVTNELAPDAKATPTGGPSGGVPGFRRP